MQVISKWRESLVRQLRDGNLDLKKAVTLPFYWKYKIVKVSIRRTEFFFKIEYLYTKVNRNSFVFAILIPT